METATIQEQNHQTLSAFAKTNGQVISADGTVIGYHQVGSGPAIVIQHGGLRAGHHYFRLAERLAEEYTVYLPDRRGRGLSGPAGSRYSIEKEIQDIQAILEKTGASILFGHSAGGYFALEAALRLAIQTLLLYEPAVSIHDSMPLDWLPKVERALSQQDSALAFTHLVKGLQLGPKRFPTWLVTIFAWLMLRGAEAQEIIALLPTIVREAREMQKMMQLGLTYERYHDIQANTLLLSGSNSPAYLRNAARELSTTLPHAAWTDLSGLEHNAPDQNAPEQIASELLKFLKSSQGKI